MADKLYTSLATYPFPIETSGQAWNPSGINNSGLEETEISWVLNTQGGSQQFADADVGVVRLAIPIGDSVQALLQNTAIDKSGDEQTEPHEEGAIDPHIYAEYDRALFKKLGLSLHTTTTVSNVCSLDLAVPVICTDEICQDIAAATGQRYAIITIQGPQNTKLPLDKFDNLNILITNGYVSHLAGEVVAYAMSYSVVAGTWNDCPSFIKSIPLTKLQSPPGVSKLDVTPKTQFLKSGEDPEKVTLNWRFSDGGIPGIKPTAKLRWGTDGDPWQEHSFDESSLKNGTFVLGYPKLGTTRIVMDYKLSANRGGRIDLETHVITDYKTTVRNPKFQGLIKGLHQAGTPILPIVYPANYIADGDGYLFCMLKVNGRTPPDPLAKENTIGSYATVTHGGIQYSLALDEVLTQAVAAERPKGAVARDDVDVVGAVDILVNQTMPLTLPIKAGNQFTINFVHPVGSILNELIIHWIPLGDSVVSASVLTEESQ